MDGSLMANQLVRNAQMHGQTEGGPERGKIKDALWNWSNPIPLALAGNQRILRNAMRDSQRMAGLRTYFLILLEH
jgi:hypothetical protein